MLAKLYLAGFLATGVPYYGDPMVKVVDSETGYMYLDMPVKPIAAPHFCGQWHIVQPDRHGLHMDPLFHRGTHCVLTMQ